MTFDEWVNKYKGSKVDYDGSYGVQCVDLADHYVTHVLGLSVGFWGNAKNWWTDRNTSQWLKNNFTFISPKYKEGETQKGDIGIRTSGNWGHIFIIANSNKNGTVNYWDENGGGNHEGMTLRCRNYNSSTVNGILRPKKQSNIGNTNQTSNSSSSETKKTSEAEILYLKKILSKKKATTAKISGTVTETNKLPSAALKVIIKNSSGIRFTVPVEDGLKVVWQRKGTPGKLTFKTPHLTGYKFEEGNSVAVYVNNSPFFFGFIFTRQMNKDKTISVTAYDQLRYFKNKDTFIYKNKTAAEVLKLLAKRFYLQCGTVVDTKYKMSAIKDNAELFDIMQSALDETLMVKDALYVLYDKFGKLYLSNINNMKVNNCLIDDETGEDYTYKISIDSNTYNQIKLVYENKDKGTFDLYVAKSSKSINQWGLLQYLEKINDPDIGKLKSNAYLKLYNRKSRSLTINGVIGNINVRAGSLIPVLLTLVDIKISNYMLVEKVTHSFSNNQYTMDLVLSGGGFSE